MKVGTKKHHCSINYRYFDYSFSWFGFQITLLYMIVLTVGFLQNNIYRIKTRPNYDLELGYWGSQLFRFIGIYLSFLKADLITYSFL